MSARYAALLLVVATSASVDSAQACAACRNPAMPTAHTSGAPLAAGSLRTDATVTATTIHVVHTAGCEDTNDCDEVPVQPLYLHDQRVTPIELRLGAEYGFSDAFGMELQLPLRTVVTRIEYTTPEGEPYEPLDRDVHHRNETLFGVADGLLLGRAGDLFSGTWLAIRVGVSLPIGKTEEDPFELGDQGLSHQHVQLGNGTFEPALSLEASRRFDGFALQGFAFGQTAVYDNEHGYRAPMRVQGSVEGSLELVSSLSMGLGVGVYHEGAERWQGVVRQDGSLGRTELTANVSFDYVIDETVLRVGGRIPWYRNIVEGEEPLGEFSSPLVAYVGASHTWDLAESP
jgi:hypothetical protein